MTVEDIMKELERLGSESTKNTFLKHGANANLFGVKVGDLKVIQKKIKKNYELSLRLFDTGNSDAMYLAGLIADEKKMTKSDLEKWVTNAPWQMISEYTVPWVAAESAYGWELANKWIDSGDPGIASSGWATLSSLVSITPDEKLEIKALEKLLDRVKKEIHKAPNRVRYTMNGFVISAGSYVPALTAKARQIGREIGKVQVEMGGTACKVPEAVAYIEKVEKAGKLGKKRKEARC